MDNKILEFPFDNEYIIKKKKSIRKELLLQDKKFLEKHIAILGGGYYRRCKKYS